LKRENQLQKVNSRFKKPAIAKTIETPRIFNVPSSSPILLIHDALITIASVPEWRGDANMA
jgi:hypothetical protein